MPGPVVTWYWPKALNRLTRKLRPPIRDPNPELPISLAKSSSGVVTAGVHDAHPDAKVRSRWSPDREGHQHRGIFPNVVEGRRNLPLAGQSADAVDRLRGVDAELVGSEALFNGEQQPGAPCGDQQVGAAQGDRGSALSRRLEVQDAAMAADVPLESAVARLLEPRGWPPQGKGPARPECLG